VFCLIVQRCCRQRRAASRRQGSNAPSPDIESDVDNNDTSDPEDVDASVRLYMPVDQDAIDPAGDSSWHNVSLEPFGHSSHVEGPLYAQLQYMPQHTQSRQWHVFTDDSSDDSDTGEPLVDFGHVCVPAQSAASTNSIEMSSSLLASTSGDRSLFVEGVQPGASCRQHP